MISPKKTVKSQKQDEVPVTVPIAKNAGEAIPDTAKPKKKSAKADAMVKTAENIAEVCPTETEPVKKTSKAKAAVKAKNAENIAEVCQAEAESEKKTSRAKAAVKAKNAENIAEVCPTETESVKKTSKAKAAVKTVADDESSNISAEPVEKKQMAEDKTVEDDTASAADSAPSLRHKKFHIKKVSVTSNKFIPKNKPANPEPEVEAGDAAAKDAPSADQTAETKKARETSRKAELAANAQTGNKNDTMKVYMGEIANIPMVNKKDEVELAERIHDAEISETERENARSELTKANLRLVVKIAHDFKGLGLPLLDLISEGNLGLMRAVEKFNPSKGAKFSSYAAWWIKQSMRRALANQSRTIRIPVQSAGKINKIKASRMRLAEKYGRDPSDSEIAADLSFSERTVAGLRSADVRTISLHDPIQQGEEGEFQDIIPDRHAMTPDQVISEYESVGQLFKLLEKLDERERRILEMRFGLYDNKSLTLEEVSQKIGRTRERVRQIQNQALNKLKQLLLEEADFTIFTSNCD